MPNAGHRLGVLLAQGRVHEFAHRPHQGGQFLRRQVAALTVGPRPRQGGEDELVEQLFRVAFEIPVGWPRRRAMFGPGLLACLPVLAAGAFLLVLATARLAKPARPGPPPGT
jgi:hypothetical protein